MKPCSRCGVNDRRGPYGNQGKSMSWCQPCLTASNRDWQQRVGKRYSRYGLTQSDLSDMTLMQGGRCDICGDRLRHDLVRPGHPAVHVDHDHASGQVRALLCGPCNQGLGNFKDDPHRLAAAVTYLRRWS